MKTFDDLFKEASEISDKRKAVLNKLIEKTEKEIIPAFAKILDDYDLDKAFFTMYVNPIHGLDPCKDEEGDKMWAIGIDRNGHVWKCNKDPYYGKYEAYWEMRTKGDESDTLLQVVEFMRVGIVDLVKKINNRTEEINKKFASKVEEAEELLQ